jgi:hypothetical protein
MSLAGLGAKPAILRCGRCGKVVDWHDSRLQVVCGCRPNLDLPPVRVREATPADREKALALFKRFEGPMEGVARRLEDGTIEVAEGFTDQPLTGHMGFDQHHIETFAFQQGEFVKVAERDVPHLLWSDAWEPYYFSEQAKE